MAPQTKKYLKIGATLAVIGGVIWVGLRLLKKPSEEQTATNGRTVIKTEVGTRGAGVQAKKDPGGVGPSFNP